MDMIYYTQANHSGAALYIFHLLRALTRQGEKVCLVCPSDYEYLDRLLVNSENLQARATIPPLDGSFSASRKVWQMLKQAAVGFYTVRALRRESPVVHANMPGLSFFSAPLLVGFRLYGFRLILNVHDVTPHRWLLPGPLWLLEWATLWIMYLMADKLVVFHHEASDLLRNRFGVRSGKVVVIPHGPFHLSDAPIPYEETNEIVALLFGSLRENKGIHLAIRALQEVRANGFPIKLVIAGHAYASEKNYWQRCQALIEASPAGITVVDRYLEDEEVKEAIASAHFLLLPYTEEFHSQSGVAALALSNGRPVVATRAGGLSEVLLPGRTGILIAQPTVESIKEALLRTIHLGHHGLRQMGWQAFELYNASYSWDAIAQEYADLYRETRTRSK
jgi:glycogen synthase